MHQQKSDAYRDINIHKNNEYNLHYASGVENNSRDSKYIHRVLFLLGTVKNATVQREINVESMYYDDIIQENFLDSYYNLTLKSIMMVKWTSDNCIGRGIYIEFEKSNSSFPFTSAFFIFLFYFIFCS